MNWRGCPPAGGLLSLRPSTQHQQFGGFRKLMKGHIDEPTRNYFGSLSFPRRRKVGLRCLGRTGSRLEIDTIPWDGMGGVGRGSSLVLNLFLFCGTVCQPQAI